MAPHAVTPVQIRPTHIDLHQAPQSAGASQRHRITTGNPATLSHGSGSSEPWQGMTDRLTPRSRRGIPRSREARPTRGPSRQQPPWMAELVDAPHSKCGAHKACEFDSRSRDHNTNGGASGNLTHRHRSMESPTQTRTSESQTQRHHTLPQLRQRTRLHHRPHTSITRTRPHHPALQRRTRPHRQPHHHLPPMQPIQRQQRNTKTPPQTHPHKPPMVTCG